MLKNYKVDIFSFKIKYVDSFCPNYDDSGVKDKEIEMIFFKFR